MNRNYMYESLDSEEIKDADKRNNNRNYRDKYKSTFRKPFLKILAIVFVISAIIGVGFLLAYGMRKDKECDECNYLGTYDSPSRLGSYKHAAVSTDSAPCAKIGRDILDQNGTAVDSIIAVLLCMGVTIPESMGLGGGSVLIFYNATTRETKVIDAREIAPAAADKDMYESNSNMSQTGPKAIGVPGELAGYVKLYQIGGKLDWKTLFEPSINLANVTGFSVSEHLDNALRQNEESIKRIKSLSDVFINPLTNETYRKGENMKYPTLAETYRRISEKNDPEESRRLFYEDISKQLIEDINAATSDWGEEFAPIITYEDIKGYKIKEREPVVANLTKKNLTINTFPLPGSGNVLSFIIRVMEKYEDLYPQAKHSFDKSVLFYHRLMETFKFAFSRRMHLGDGDFDNVEEVIANLTSQQFIDDIWGKIDDSQTFKANSSHYDAEYFMNEDHGTAHVSVVDQWGNAAAVSTTVNLYFGSQVLSPSTGILLNDQMDDFSSPNITNYFGVPPSKYNHIFPGKRPLSSMNPAIFTDTETGKVRLVIGASGGTKITTAVAIVALRHLFFEEDIKTAIDAPRLHHQLFPDEIVYETNFRDDTLVALHEKYGHPLKYLGGARGAIVMAISMDENQVKHANSDWRKGGEVDGF